MHFPLPIYIWPISRLLKQNADPVLLQRLRADPARRKELLAESLLSALVPLRVLWRTQRYQWAQLIRNLGPLCGFSELLRSRARRKAFVIGLRLRGAGVDSESGFGSSCAGGSSFFVRGSPQSEFGSGVGRVSFCDAEGLRSRTLG